MVQRASHGDNLPQRDSAIIRRHALMPIRLETFIFQPIYRALRQVAILKTSAAQSDARTFNMRCHPNNRLDECIVEFR